MNTGYCTYIYLFENKEIRLGYKEYILIKDIFILRYHILDSLSLNFIKITSKLNNYFQKYKAYPCGYGKFTPFGCTAHKKPVRYITKKPPMQTRRDRSRKNHSNIAL